MACSQLVVRFWRSPVSGHYQYELRVFQLRTPPDDDNEETPTTPTPTPTPTNTTNTTTTSSSHSHSQSYGQNPSYGPSSSDNDSHPLAALAALAAAAAAVATEIVVVDSYGKEVGTDVGLTGDAKNVKRMRVVVPGSSPFSSSLFLPHPLSCPRPCSRHHPHPHPPKSCPPPHPPPFRPLPLLPLQRRSVMQA